MNDSIWGLHTLKPEYTEREFLRPYMTKPYTNHSRGVLRWCSPINNHIVSEMVDFYNNNSFGTPMAKRAPNWQEDTIFNEMLLDTVCCTTSTVDFVPLWIYRCGGVGYSISLADANNQFCCLIAGKNTQNPYQTNIYRPSLYKKTQPARRGVCVQNTGLNLFLRNYFAYDTSRITSSDHRNMAAQMAHATVMDVDSFIEQYF